jgi:hypothetical protein
MKNSHLRETVEIIGVISIVAALLLVAWEVRQSNRIAVAKIEMELAHGFDEMNMIRATTPDFARLFPKMNSPASHLVTATEESQLQGLAWHIANLYYSAQTAHDNGLLDAQRLDMYRLDLAQTLDRFPGLHAPFLQIYDALPEMGSMPVFQPLRDLEARSVPQDTGATPDAD